LPTSSIRNRSTSTMRLLVESDLKPAGGIVGVSFDEFRRPRPLRPGDALSVEAEMLDVRPSRSNSDRGIVQDRQGAQHDDQPAWGSRAGAGRQPDGPAEACSDVIARSVPTLRKREGTRRLEGKEVAE